MSSIEQKAKADIDAYIKKNGGAYSAWYVGVARDPRSRLFKDHNVDEHRGNWIYCDCKTDAAARRVEKYFLEKGCKGGDGGGDRNTRFVYAYKITRTTRE